MASRRILIVDDEPNIVIPLQFLMEQNHYEVMSVSSGDEVIDAIVKFKPDLILLDIMLPGIDGFEICQNLREDPVCRIIKIIFLSAMGRDMDIAKGLALGVDAYITKPFSNSDVVLKVKELLKETVK